MVKKLMTGKSHSADPFDDEPEKNPIWSSFRNGWRGGIYVSLTSTFSTRSD